MKVHQKVKFFREEKGLTQENIAAQLGIDQSQYSRREKGQVPFTGEEIGRISKILEINPSEFYDCFKILNNNNQQGGENFQGSLFENFTSNNEFNNKLLVQYEHRIEQYKNELIAKDTIIEAISKERDNYKLQFEELNKNKNFTN